MESLVITPTSQTPIYQQLYEQIASQILNGLIKGDTQLPSVRTMAKELRVSIITIKKAWELLERDGYIYTMAGKGSYVKNNTKQYLDNKRIKIVKDALKDNIKLIKDMNVTKEEVLEIIFDLYDK